MVVVVVTTYNFFTNLNSVLW